jgi:glutamate formiminotransferase / 5-formyltetrahydrofolate cyclo-ligase
VLECVVNVSEGRDRAVLDALAGACGRALLDVHADVDHHRAVLTLAGPVESAVTGLAAAAFARLDLAAHAGVHPRLGVLDVVPFVALDGEDAVAVAAARRTAKRLAREFGVPTFCYDLADPEGRTLPSVRRDAFVRRAPDHGPDRPHARFGAVAVGARRLLVAVNVEVAPVADGPAGDALAVDVALAREVAHAVRERDGGLPGVRALAFPLASRGVAQVSMNLVDLPATGVEAACDGVAAALAARGRRAGAVELVGLVPAAELARWSDRFRAWTGLDESVAIEARLVAAGLAPAAG